ncbi:unnamed protein product, partial [Mesorhabditis spiculigera]
MEKLFLGLFFVLLAFCQVFDARPPLTQDEIKEAPYVDYFDELSLNWLDSASFKENLRAEKQKYLLSIAQRRRAIMAKRFKMA